MKIRDDLMYDLCIGCGEIAPKGLIPSIMHDCPSNTVTLYYDSSRFSIRHFHDMAAGRDVLKPFRDLLSSPYFKRMPDIDSATELDKILYSICREDAIKTMKRLRAYIQLEEKFNAIW